MKIYATHPLDTLDADDRKIVWDLLNDILARENLRPAKPFYFEYRGICMMFAPDCDFFTGIPDMPLPCLGGDIAGTLILAGVTAANDRLPLPLEDSLL